MLQETKDLCKVLSNKLSRVLLTEDTKHKQLFSGMSEEFQIYENENLLFKIRLKDQPPPLTITVKYLQANRRDLTIFLSWQFKEPSQTQHDKALLTKLRIDGASQASKPAKFLHDWVYLSVASVYGCKFKFNCQFKVDHRQKVAKSLDTNKQDDLKQ